MKFRGPHFVFRRFQVWRHEFVERMACPQKEMLKDRDGTRQRERERETEIQIQRKNCHEKERQEKKGGQGHQEIKIL